MTSNIDWAEMIKEDIFSPERLEMVSSVMAEVLEKTGPIEQTLLFYLVERKRLKGENSLNFFTKGGECYDAMYFALKLPGKFFLQTIPEIGLCVYLLNQQKEIIRTLEPKKYEKAYYDLLVEYNVFKNTHLGTQFTVFDYRVPVNYMDGYYDLAEKFEAVKDDPELLYVPDSYLDKSLRLIDDMNYIRLGDVL